MIPTAFSTFVNHLLRQQSWAGERLGAHAGARIRIVLPPALPLPFSTRPDFSEINLVVLASGLIAVDAGEITPDLRVVLKPAAIPLLLVRHSDALKHVELSGGASLASLVQELVTRLEWDVEEDLSRLVGDIAAHRIATAGKDFFAWQRDALHRTAANFADYWSDENPMLVRHAEFDQFTRELQATDDDLARIETRLNALLARTAASPV